MVTQVYLAIANSLEKPYNGMSYNTPLYIDVYNC